MNNGKLFCPKCGDNTLIKNTFKSFTCNSCGFVFFFNAAAAVTGIIELPDGNIIMTVRKHAPAAGMLDLPGGFIDYDETAEEALKREINEELNIEIDDIKYLTTIPNTYIFESVTYKTLDIFFKCKAKNIELIKPNDDVSEFIFINPKKVKLEQIGLDSVKKLFNTVLR